MYIYGIGTDIIEIERIKKAMSQKGFIARVFSEAEISLLDTMKTPYPSAAANFCAKEAFAKALGTGVRGFSLSEISALRDDMGKPYIELSGAALKLAEEKGLRFELTLSHSKEQAVAFIIAYRD